MISLFKAILKLQTLQEIASISSSVVKEVRVIFSTSGIDLRAVDGSHVGMISLNYKDKVYTEVNGDPCVLCFELSKLSKTLSLGKPDTSVELNYEQTNNRLVFKMGDLTRNMTLLTPDAVPNVPEMQKLAFPAYCIVKLEDVMLGIKAAGIVESDEIRMSLTNENGLHMYADNNNDTFDVKLPKEKLQKYDIKEVKDDKNNIIIAESIYPLKMFSDLATELRHVEQVVLYMGKDFPLRIQFDLSGGTGTGRFMLAPRTRQAE